VRNTQGWTCHVKPNGESNKRLVTFVNTVGNKGISNVFLVYILLTSSLTFGPFCSFDTESVNKWQLKKLRGFGPRANYTDRSTAACWRIYCQLLRIVGVACSAQRISTVVNLGFLDRSRCFFLQVAPQLSSWGCLMKKKHGISKKPFVRVGTVRVWFRIWIRQRDREDGGSMFLRNVDTRVLGHMCLTHNITVWTSVNELMPVGAETITPYKFVVNLCGDEWLAWENGMHLPCVRTRCRNLYSVRVLTTGSCVVRGSNEKMPTHLRTRCNI
jgi:hypothetical protein